MTPTDAARLADACERAAETAGEHWMPPHDAEQRASLLAAAEHFRTLSSSSADSPAAVAAKFDDLIAHADVYDTATIRRARDLLRCAAAADSAEDAAKTSDTETRVDSGAGSARPGAVERPPLTPAHVPARGSEETGAFSAEDAAGVADEIDGIARFLANSPMRVMESSIASIHRAAALLRRGGGEGGEGGVCRYLR